MLNGMPLLDQVKGAEELSSQLRSAMQTAQELSAREGVSKSVNCVIKTRRNGQEGFFSEFVVGDTFSSSGGVVMYVKGRVVERLDYSSVTLGYSDYLSSLLAKNQSNN